MKLLLVFVLVGCSRASYPSSRLLPPPLPAQPSAAVAPAVPTPWQRLVESKQVERHVELDAACRDRGVGHALLPPVSTEAIADAKESGCAPLPSVSSSLMSALAQLPVICCPARLPVAPEPHSAGLKSCERAVYEYVEGLRGEQPPEAEGVTNDQFSDVLNRGAYLGHCGVPEEMAIRICTAIRDGVAVGISVRTAPASASHEDCIAESIRGLSFPASRRLHRTLTVF